MTHSSRLLPVSRHGKPAMLKIAQAEEERCGGALMLWWSGQGAARVIAHHEDKALLLERAEDKTTLADLAKNGNDEEASRILCRVAAQLHAPRINPPPETIPLARWFRELKPAAMQHGGILAFAAATARELLTAPREAVILHGDIHHGNILDFGSQGWLAIDPKGLRGERGFEYANIFCNPNGEIALAPNRLAQQSYVIAQAAGLERRQLLQWVLCHAGLSAAWCLNDGDRPDFYLDVAELAMAELARS